MTIAFDVNIFWDECNSKIKYRTLADYEFAHGDQKIIIPAGYITDFATVPRLLWSIIPPIGRHNRAALLHDYLYDNRIGSRIFADKLFKKILLEDGVGRLKAEIMYLGVRIGGRKWWIDD